jgi:hypothetical protein
VVGAVEVGRVSLPRMRGAEVARSRNRLIDAGHDPDLTSGPESLDVSLLHNLTSTLSPNVRALVRRQGLASSNSCSTTPR